MIDKWILRAKHPCNKSHYNSGEIDAYESVLCDIVKLPPSEPERTAKVTDTWKVAGSDELNAWCPECEHRITRGCSYCPTCGVKLDWSE